jgi:hypothetical protein
MIRCYKYICSVVWFSHPVVIYFFVLFSDCFVSSSGRAGISFYHQVLFRHHHHISTPHLNIHLNQHHDKTHPYAPLTRFLTQCATPTHITHYTQTQPHLYTHRAPRQNSATNSIREELVPAVMRSPKFHSFPRPHSLSPRTRQTSTS